MSEQQQGQAEFKFECPHCSQHFSATPDLSGTENECPTCGQRFTVPLLTRANATFEPSSAIPPPLPNIGLADLPKAQTGASAYQTDTSEFFVQHGGEQFGPYSSEDIRQFLKLGAFKPDDLAWTKGMVVWSLLSELFPNAPFEKPKPKAARRKRTNYFIRHWRGELSLGVSYWANGFLGTFLVLLAANTLAAMRNTADLKLLAGLSLFVYALAIVASVWQFVGVWRSASNHVSRGGQSSWATLAKVLVVIGALNCIGLFWKSYIPQSAEMARIMAGDVRTPPYKIRVLPGGTEVEFRGGFRAGCAKELEGILSAVPQAKVLHVESIGGRINEANKMMQLVRDRGLTTYTSEQCLSAATLVLMSGKERVVEVNARVGFHAGTLPGATVEQQRAMDNLVRSTMRSAGVSEQFTSRVLATPSDQMWYPTFDEMLKAGVITSRKDLNKQLTDSLQGFVNDAQSYVQGDGNETVPKLKSTGDADMDAALEPLNAFFQELFGFLNHMEDELTPFQRDDIFSASGTRQEIKHPV